MEYWSSCSFPIVTDIPITNSLDSHPYGGIMKKTVQKMIPAFFFIIFSILIVTTFQADADQTGTVDNFLQNSSAAAKLDAPALSGTENNCCVGYWNGFKYAGGGSLAG